MADKIDFSKLERLTPREDSWAKVCARLDADARAVPAKDKIINIKGWYSAIPLAASLVLVCFTAFLPHITEKVENTEPLSTEYVSINESAPSEFLSWFSSLGNSTSDEFETLEETVGFSYLIKE